MFVNVVSSANRIIGTYQTSNIQKPDVVSFEKESKSSENNSFEEIQDKAEISQESKDLLTQEKAIKSNANKSEEDLNSEEKAQLNELKKTDREVKTHEQAHMSAAGGVATSTPKYEYEKGPDGKMYAVGGEVNIKMAEESSPEQTIEKAEQVKKAALAPSDPSGQDRSVAQKADQMIQKAKAAYKSQQTDPEQTNLKDDTKNKEQKGTLMEVFV